MKFHENPSSGSRDVLYGRTEGQIDGDREPDMTELIVAFRNFASTPKITLKFG
jgi:hypothetical protein